MTKAYARDLEQFVSLCLDLVERGLPYVAVILCHELFRFLYPVEPYAGIEHDDPVAFAESHIRRLTAEGQAFAAAVVPYAPSLGGGGSAAAPLAHETSDLYTSLWAGLDERALVQESRTLLERRLPPDLVDRAIRGARVVDIGCGSGRYSLSLAAVGAGDVVAVDYQAASFEAARAYARRHALPVEFREADVLELPFADGTFDFAFCNGVLHHTASLERGIAELARVLRPGGSGFLYLYGAGGIFWETRAALRRIFEHIPLDYTKTVLDVIGMPANRFIFCDTWYVPVERHVTTEELEAMLARERLEFEKVVGRNAFDLDGAIARGVKGAREMWGDGEHRYVVSKPAG